MPATMSSDSSSAKASGNMLQTQTEKPLHYTYLKTFRNDQCPLFLQHKCTQHKPFTCFYWHFMNQRRRRPVRKRDGTFNYSPDVYCTKYDETTGICPEGDDCPYLHRTAGDTERRYHLRYYKTGICVYDTDSRGYCVKNGPHCAFAHGIHDLRNPVYDVRELQAMENGGSGGNGNGGNGQPSLLDGFSSSLNGGNGGGGDSVIGPNSLDKERNALNEDPSWQDTTYVLANYKTELCKRPPRLCRQGYACPQFHNNKDKRRSPKTFKYRSTPCPNVKQGDEWGDPGNCEAGENCPYCHTRTEQQFHPEIYKSTKCNDMQQTGYCPRGPFCAFAHVDKEMTAIRDLESSSSQGHELLGRNGHSNKPLATIASSLPDHYPLSALQLEDNHFRSQLQNVFSSKTESSQVSQSSSGPGVIARPRSYSHSQAHSSSHFSNGSTGLHNPLGSAHMPNFYNRERSGTDARDQARSATASALFGDRKSPLFGNLPAIGSNNNVSKPRDGNSFSFESQGFSNTVESVVGSALDDDLSLDDIHHQMEGLEKETSGANRSMDNEQMHSNTFFAKRETANSLSTAPVNIPGASRFSSADRNNSSPVGASPLGASIGHHGPFGASPYARANSVATGTSVTSSLYDFSAGTNMSPLKASIQDAFGASVNQAAVSVLENHRLKEELALAKNSLAKVSNYDMVMELKRQLDDAKARERRAEQQRDDAMEMLRANTIQKEYEQNQRNVNSPSSILTGGRSRKDLENMSIMQLQQLKQNLRAELDCVDKVLALRAHHSA